MFPKYKWKAKISKKNIILKSLIIIKIKNFFFTNNILEINTPQICTTNTLSTNTNFIYVKNYFFFKKNLFLQISPEFYMKTLLISGIQSIYQITKAYRGKDISKIHNPEFFILEIYRKKYNTQMLIKEIIKLLKKIINSIKIKKTTYSMLFNKHLNIIPNIDSIYKIIKILHKYKINYNNNYKNKNEYLNILLKFKFKNLYNNMLLIIYNYYLKQSEMALKKKKISDRFEFYINNIEISNGANEIKNYNTIIKMFSKYNKKNKQIKNIINNNMKFISALYHGLPKCAGIAIGIDRLIMILLKKNNIKYINTFLK